MDKPYSSTNGPIPQHSTFKFEEIEFSSDFDSGNLHRVEQVEEKYFALWVGPDCCNTLCEKSMRTWFYFNVCASGNYKFTIKNLNLQGKLFRDGMKPLVKTPTKNWERFEGSLTCDVKGDVGSHFEITFSYTFQESPVYFAFSFPWSYSDHKVYIAEVLKGCDRNNVYLHHENLIYSLEKRTCDLLTISSYDRITSKFEKGIIGLFENSPVRAYKFKDKQVIFISARVHAAETPSSRVVKGIIDFLISNDLRAAALRENYVFKIVPMINPDGVFRGHFRTDTRGNDLNRQYASPSINQHPTVFAIRELLTYYKGKLWLYLDCHAHVSKQGSFVYGNSLEFQQQIKNVMFAKIMTLNCPWFSFEGCSFADDNFESRDKNSKDGSGRVAVYKNFSLVHSYTLECNYHSCRVLNHGLQHTDCRSSIFEESSFEKIGMSAMISVLYLSGKHPSPEIDMEKLQLEISQYLADLMPYKANPDIRKASRSIENLSKYLTSFKNGNKKYRNRLMNIINTAEKACRNSFNASSRKNLPQISSTVPTKEQTQIIIKDLQTKVVTLNNNSFQIRKRNSSYIKGHRSNKHRNRSSNAKPPFYPYLDMVLM